MTEPLDSPWLSFIAEAATHEEDDPYVRLLRERLESGATLVRVNFVEASSEYRVVLEVHHRLSELRIPHSRSFTRWSNENGVAMADTCEEAARVKLLLREYVSDIERGFENSIFDSLFVDAVKRLGPPLTTARLSRRPSSLGRLDTRSAIDQRYQFDEVLHRLADALQTAWRYNAHDAAAVLDEALLRFAEERYQLALAEGLFPR